MTSKLPRDIGNLLIYGGAFTGLCAACITALTFELTGSVLDNLQYVFLIGAATSALYCSHRVIGLTKTSGYLNSERLSVIRKYQFHIRVYTIFWIMLAFWLLAPLFSIRFILCLLPGGVIALSYVIPFLSGGRRLRDLGWTKILMIGWSWGWLTAVIPLWYFTDAPIQMILIHGLERMLFIMLLCIPFEIRDLQFDRYVGLITFPDKFGKKRTRRIALVICGFAILLSFIASFHYFNPAYGIAMSMTCLLVIPTITYSYSINDDYFFGGLVDGFMILALWLFVGVHYFI